MALTLPIKPHSSSVSAFTATSPGKRGITRHDEARYEGAYDRSYEGQFAFHRGLGIPKGIWRNLRGGRESIEGDYGGGGCWEAEWEAIDARALINTANLEKRHTHTQTDRQSTGNTQRCVCINVRAARRFLNKPKYKVTHVQKRLNVCVHRYKLAHTLVNTHSSNKQ